ncbi:hypothetical protein J7L70_00130 [Candidatus Bathyarchaeota archaeon]|nr:hypothetical protein [Candidatus Bathyarchaeota archaeon]
MKGEHQSVLTCNSVHELMPGGYDLLGIKVDCRIPFWPLYMDGIEHRIRDIQQPM